ncbi:MAG: tetratricopeptide repeat protein [Deltaproteobacteria bacterium]|nr:tetratricopeptide repeat protein [Deltaproteobacteria bacterium]
MSKQNSQSNENKKDYLAIGVFTVVLLLLTVSTIYLVRTTKKDTFNYSFRAVFKWIDNYWHEGKRFIESKKGTWSTSKKEKEIIKHYRTGHSLYRGKKYSGALHEFDKTIELDPNNYLAHFWRGRTYIKIKRYREATIDFQTVIKIKPDYAEAYDNMGWLYLQLDEYDESIKYLSQSLQLKPNDGWVYYTRGRCYFNKGDLEKALKDTKTSCSLGYKKGCQAYKDLREEIS